MELLFIFQSGNVFSGKVTLAVIQTISIIKQRTLLGTEAVNEVT